MDGRASGRNPGQPRGGPVMIADFFWTLVHGLLDTVVTSMPEDNPLSTTNVDWSMLSAINYFLPVSEMAGLLGSFMLLGIPFGLVTLGIWIFVGVVRGGAPKA